jgi:DNA-binding LacI/PurR family transcriptional regulator
VDVSATGFGDMPAAAAAEITTVRQPIRERGRLMGRMLLDPSMSERQLMPPFQLVTRASSGPAASAAALMADR